MAFADLQDTIAPRRQGSGHEVAGVGPEAHRPAHFINMGLFLHQMNDGVKGRRVHLLAVRPRQGTDVAGILDHHHLHAQADPEQGDPLLTGVPNSADHPLDPP